MGWNVWSFSSSFVIMTQQIAFKSEADKLLSNPTSVSQPGFS